MTTRSIHLLAASLLLAAPAAGQTTVVDAGTFRIDVRGTPIGTETFTIRRSGSGANASIIAQGRIVLDTGRRTRTVLHFRGSELRPTAYQIEVTGDDRQNVTGRATGNRFRATVVSTEGERMREYLVEPGAVILDNGTAHHHYFIARATTANGAVPVILPRENRQVDARVQDRGSESVQVAGQQLAAHRFDVQLGDLDPRTIWVDADNRVLRIRIPAQDLVAVRTTLP